MSKKLSIPQEVIVSKIHLIRGKKVMLDRDLADLYGVTTGNLNKAVNRNIKRFPQDFMFQLNKEEFDNLIFQIGTSRRGGTRKLPNAFTEQGVAMLSGVLNSDRAIKVNIQIIRVFTRMREMLLTHKDMLLKMEKMEQKLARHGQSIAVIFELMDKLIQEKSHTNEQIGLSSRKRNNPRFVLAVLVPGRLCGVFPHMPPIACTASRAGVDASEK